VTDEYGEQPILDDVSAVERFGLCDTGLKR